MVILNIPAAENINDSALRIYFKSWASLVELDRTIRSYCADLYTSDDKMHASEEWKTYSEASQPELQTICGLLQQSNELALKSRICAESPFLLLLGGNYRFSAAKDVEFGDLRTIDAADLPAAVNQICYDRVSDKYISFYRKLRILRNKIVHLGNTDNVFSIDQIVQMMLDQYVELWPNRFWLQDRFAFASQTAEATLYDGKYVSTHMEIFLELPFIFRSIKGSNFKKLFKITKNTRRYFCFKCFDAAATRYSGLDDVENLTHYHTAFLIEESKFVECLVCGERSEVVKGECSQDNCKGSIVSGDQGMSGRCYTCGIYPE